MDERGFWSLIEKLDWDEDDPEDIVEPLVEALAARPVDEIFGFDDILHEKLFALDTEAHARATGWPGGDAYLSPDAFLYARCAVVANGREAYEAALRDAATVADADFEWLLAVPEDAYERKTGDDEYPHVSELSYETYSNAAGWRR